MKIYLPYYIGEERGIIWSSSNGANARKLVVIVENGVENCDEYTLIGVAKYADLPHHSIILVSPPHSPQYEPKVVGIYYCERGQGYEVLTPHLEIYTNYSVGGMRGTKSRFGIYWPETVILCGGYLYLDRKMGWLYFGRIEDVLELAPTPEIAKKVLKAIKNYKSS